MYVRRKRTFKGWRRFGCRLRCVKEVKNPPKPIDERVKQGLSLLAGFTVQVDIYYRSPGCGDLYENVERFSKTAVIAKLCPHLSSFAGSFNRQLRPASLKLYECYALESTGLASLIAVFNQNFVGALSERQSWGVFIISSIDFGDVL